MNLELVKYHETKDEVGNTGYYLKNYLWPRLDILTISEG